MVYIYPHHQAFQMLHPRGKIVRCFVKHARFAGRAQTQYTEESEEVSSPKDIW